MVGAHDDSSVCLQGLHLRLFLLPEVRDRLVLTGLCTGFRPDPSQVGVLMLGMDQDVLITGVNNRFLAYVRRG